MSRNRLLLVGPRRGQRITGIRECFELLIDALTAAGAQFDVVDTVEGLASKRAGSLGFRRIVEMARLLPRAWRHLFRARTVYLTLATSRAGALRDALVIWPAAIAGCRIVGHLHGGGYATFYENQPSVYRWFLRATLRRTHTLIVLADALRDQFAFDGKLNDRIEVVGNGLPFERPRDWPEAKQLPANGPVRILYLSNMIRSKGYLDLLDACAHLVNVANANIQADFCGEFVQTSVDETTSDDADAFAARIASDKLEHCVRWHGLVTGEKKHALLNDCHLLVLPTAFPWEGQPICIIEALASATPVVATSHRAIPEMIRDGVEGRLVPLHDSRGIADAIMQLAADPQTYWQASVAAKKRFDDQFRREFHTERMLRLLIR